MRWLPRRRNNEDAVPESTVEKNIEEEHAAECRLKEAEDRLKETMGQSRKVERISSRNKRLLQDNHFGQMIEQAWQRKADT